MVAVFSDRLFPMRRFRRRQPMKRIQQAIVKHSNDESTSMRGELEKLASTVINRKDRKAFNHEMNAYHDLFVSYLRQKETKQSLDWAKLAPLSGDSLVSYDDLSKKAEAKLLDKLAVVKLAGGVSEPMGMDGAKAGLKIKKGTTLLDIAIRQVADLNAAHATSIPLYFMTSFSTDAEVSRLIEGQRSLGENGQPFTISTFLQSQYPLISESNDKMLPMPSTAYLGRERATMGQEWYSPGDGDIFRSLRDSGLLGQMLKQGKEYIFISDIDNPGAIPDDKILHYFCDSGLEMAMEVTEKTAFDLAEGALLSYGGHPRLLETRQVPLHMAEDFKSNRIFRRLNTNNLWINLKAMKSYLEHNTLNLDVLDTKRHTQSGADALQLEISAGSAVRLFKRVQGITIPRTRYIPCKTTSDLLILRSDVYDLQDSGRISLQQERQFSHVPRVKLCQQFENVTDFERRIKNVPSIAELDHLTVTGDVTFGKNVVLRGTVIVVAKEGERIDIPDGVILENKLVAGNLTVIAV